MYICLVLISSLILWDFGMNINGSGASGRELPASSSLLLSRTTRFGPFGIRECSDNAETEFTFPSSSPQSKKSVLNF